VSANRGAPGGYRADRAQLVRRHTHLEWKPSHMPSTLRRPMAQKNDIFCEAIRRRALLEFQYKGHLRVVQPYCYGISTRDMDVLRAIQVRGTSSSNQFGIGKLWSAEEVLAPRILDETFTPNDGLYNRNDSAMKHIYCRI
jgi:hypothetical protein